MTSLINACLLVATLASRPSAAASPDLKKLTDHMHKAFSTPLTMKLEVKDLAPAEVHGFLAGKLVITEEGKSQSQPILVSRDGRWYIVGALYRVAPSPVPGFSEVQPTEGLPPPPPLLLSADGKHAVAGKPQDASIDPDKDTFAKMNRKGVPFAGPENAPIAIKVTLESSPIPIHSSRSGTRASDGIARKAASIGLRRTSPAFVSPTTAAPANPITDPMANPSRTR